MQGGRTRHGLAQQGAHPLDEGIGDHVALQDLPGRIGEGALVVFRPRSEVGGGDALLGQHAQRLQRHQGAGRIACEFRIVDRKPEVIGAPGEQARLRGHHMIAGAQDGHPETEIVGGPAAQPPQQVAGPGCGEHVVLAGAAHLLALFPDDGVQGLGVGREREPQRAHLLGQLAHAPALVLQEAALPRGAALLQIGLVALGQVRDHGRAGFGEEIGRRRVARHQPAETEAAHAQTPENRLQIDHRARSRHKAVIVGERRADGLNGAAAALIRQEALDPALPADDGHAGVRRHLGGGDHVAQIEIGAGEFRRGGAELRPQRALARVELVGPARLDADLGSHSGAPPLRCASCSCSTARRAPAQARQPDVGCEKGKAGALKRQAVRQPSKPGRR